MEESPVRGLSLKLLNAALANVDVLGERSIMAFKVREQFPAHRALVSRLRVTWESPHTDLPQTVIAKFCDGDAFEAEGLPEIRFFQELAPLAGPLPIPPCLGWLVDHYTRSSLLLTGDLSDRYQHITPPVPDRTIQTIVDEIASLHARFWNHPILQNDQFATPRDNETRMPQSAPSSVVCENAVHLGPCLTAFMNRFDEELTPAEIDLLDVLLQHWGEVCLDRVKHGNITLIHGDFHLRGNIFMAKTNHGGHADDVRIIDWADCKPGLGPHDIAYCLITADANDRVARDAHILRRYHQDLQDLGISAYEWDQCLWDYRFSLLTNLLQCVLQQSLTWFRKTLEIILAWRCLDLLAPHPVSLSQQLLLPHRQDDPVANHDAT